MHDTLEKKFTAESRPARNSVKFKSALLAQEQVISAEHMLTYPSEKDYSDVESVREKPMEPKHKKQLGVILPEISTFYNK
jgi:hypothetical protein